MNVATVLRKKAIEFCNKHNRAVMVEALKVHYHRDKESFDVVYHTKNNDKTGFTNGCGCKYCMTLHRYAKAKKTLHRLEKKLEKDYVSPPYRSYEEISETAISQKKYCEELRRKLVEISINLQVPNSIKRKGKI